MLLLLLAAVAMGLSNFAGAIAIGASGVDNRTRIRVGAVFGVFETGMPVLGLALGHGVEGDVGGASRWLAAGLLIGIGAYQIVQAVREASDDDAPDVSSATQLRRLWLTGFALSIDNLAIGFALGAYDVNVVIAIAVIAVVSVGMSLVGLELGARIGTRIGARGEMLGGILLAALGVAIALGALAPSHDHQHPGVPMSVARCTGGYEVQAVRCSQTGQALRACPGVWHRRQRVCQQPDERLVLNVGRRP